MNKRNLVAAMVFLGLCSVVLGAPGDPNPALKRVSHDATLTGDGTPAAPLSVVGGGTQGGVRVVDSIGQNVGPFQVNHTVLRDIGGGVTLLIHVGKGGIKEDTATDFFHTSSDCSGPRYLVDDPDHMYRVVLRAGDQLFYPADPLTELVFRSFERIAPPADPDGPGACFPSSPDTRFAGQAASLNLATLHLVPPFHLEF